MTRLYLKEQGSHVGLSGGRILVTDKNKQPVSSIPKNNLEAVYIFGNQVITGQCINYLLVNDIPTVYLTSKGKYIGNLESKKSKHRIDLIKNQLELLNEEDIKLSLAKKIVVGKINNQSELLCNISGTEEQSLCSKYDFKISSAKNITELIGIEGIAAKEYFEIIGELIPKEYHFEKRCKHVHTDIFNVLLNMGSHLLGNEIRANIECLGLNTYIPFLHQESTRYPALVYDLIEEWRAIIIDYLAIEFANNYNKSKYYKTNAKGVFLSDEGTNQYIQLFEKRLDEKAEKVIKKASGATLRDQVFEQCKLYKESIRLKNVDLYIPVALK